MNKTLRCFLLVILLSRGASGRDFHSIEPLTTLLKSAAAQGGIIEYSATWIDDKKKVLRNESLSVNPLTRDFDFRTYERPITETTIVAGPYLVGEPQHLIFGNRSIGSEQFVISSRTRELLKVGGVDGDRKLHNLEGYINRNTLSPLLRNQIEEQLDLLQRFLKEKLDNSSGAVARGEAIVELTRRLDALQGKDGATLLDHSIFPVPATKKGFKTTYVKGEGGVLWQSVETTNPEGVVIGRAAARMVKDFPVALEPPAGWRVVKAVAVSNDDKPKIPPPPAGKEIFGFFFRRAGDNSLEVQKVLDGSIAQKAGLKVGDIIRKIDGIPCKELPQDRLLQFFLNPSLKLELSSGKEILLKK